MIHIRELRKAKAPHDVRRCEVDSLRRANPSSRFLHRVLSAFSAGHHNSRWHCHVEVAKEARPGADAHRQVNYKRRLQGLPWSTEKNRLAADKEPFHQPSQAVGRGGKLRGINGVELEIARHGWLWLANILVFSLP